MNKKALLFFIIFFTYGSSIFALEKLRSQPIVDEIEITGLWRTQPNVVKRELLFQENDRLDTEALKTSIQRLKNLRIFSKVIPLLELKPDNKVKLTLEMEEKWSTIPFFSIAGGGGTTYLKAGIFDINTLGRYIETGIQYDNVNGKHGGLAWIRNPRFLDKRLLFGLDIWSTNRVRQLFTKDAESQGNYVLQTKKINFLLKKEITPTFQLGAAFELNNSDINDQITNDLTDPETIKMLNNNNPDTAAFGTLFFELGKLNYDIYLIDGKFTRLGIKYSNQTLGSVKSTTQLDWSTRMFWRLPYSANAGFRFKTGWTNTVEIQDLYYIGGFNNVRGYLDGQFRNSTFWQLNTEYRIPSFRNSWLVLQHIFFVDIVGTGNNLDELKKNGMQYGSAGIGLRIISPRIYSFNGRIDIALFTSGESPSYISFGTQQYF